MAIDRRAFLRLGGVTVAGVVAAACTSDKPRTQPGQTTTTLPVTTTTGPSPSDLALVKTVASLEALAVSVYQRAAATNIVKDNDVLDATTLFLAHHMTQQQTLNALLQTAQLPAVTAPNAEVDKVFRPALTAAKTQDDVVQLLFTLEDALCQTYVYATGIVTRPEQRVALMQIAGAQARHRTWLGLTFAKQSADELFRSSFSPSDNPLPPDAIVS